ncbi:unnamed protein product [Clavelina lepadiformis]|uniref:Uncharacterized protein n=1 Tax=Clavelina lepadiformis TaxID=159417 RepID=A0ABP0GTB9_CLALP
MAMLFKRLQNKVDSNCSDSNRYQFSSRFKLIVTKNCFSRIELRRIESFSHGQLSQCSTKISLRNFAVMNYRLFNFSSSFTPANNEWVKAAKPMATAV